MPAASMDIINCPEHALEIWQLYKCAKIQTFIQSIICVSHEIHSGFGLKFRRNQSTREKILAPAMTGGLFDESRGGLH